MSRLNRVPVLCAHTLCCLIVSLFIFFHLIVKQYYLSLQHKKLYHLRVHSWLVCHVNQQKGIVFITGILCGLHRWISSRCYLLYVSSSLGNLTTVMFSCSPSKFCISRKQASNPWELTFSTQRVAASCFWPSTECSAVRKT